MSIVASFFRGRAVYLSASLGSTSSLAEKNMFFRSLSGSLTLGSGLGERLSLHRSLSGSWTLLASYRSGGSLFIENLRANFNGRAVLSGHSDCSENIIVNCGNSTASFAFLVIAVGVSLFGVYAVKQRRRSRAPRRGPEGEKVFVDKEGWETKHED